MTMTFSEELRQFIEKEGEILNNNKINELTAKIGYLQSDFYLFLNIMFTEINLINNIHVLINYFSYNLICLLSNLIMSNLFVNIIERSFLLI